MEIIALLTYYQTSTAALFSQMQVTLNQVSTYTFESAAPYPNQVLVYTSDPVSAPNPNPVPAHILKLIPALAQSQVPAYEANAMQPIQNRYFSEKYEYQQPQVIYETQAMYKIPAIITTTIIKVTVYKQAVLFPQSNKTQPLI